MMRRILITGSRDWVARTTVWNALNAELQQFGSLVVVHGACVVRGKPAGADDIADRWAWGMLQAGYNVRPEAHPAADFEAEWGPKVAPVKRNEFMVSLGADVVHAFPLEGSRGTRNCMSYAYAAEIPVVNHGWQAYTTEAQEFAEAYLKTTPKTRKALL